MRRQGVDFVAADFVVPATFDGADFRLRMLHCDDVHADYAAVMSSAQHLARVWPESGWPGALTLAENLADLQRHQHEFETRQAFAYTMVRPDESEVLGCVYINPTRRRGYDAEVFMWVRVSELAAGLDARLQRDVSDWLASCWPFRRPAMPGRTVSWDDWNAIGEDTS